MRKVTLVVSGAGYGNYGDDVILSRWLTAYRGHELVLVAGPNLESHEGLRPLRHFLLHEVCHDEIMGYLSSTGPLRAVHLLGGGYCTDTFGTAPPLFRLLENLQRLAPIIGTGVSFVPLGAASLEILQRIRFRYVSTRDRATYDHTRGDVRLMLGDDLLPFCASRRASTPGRRPTLYVNIQNQFDVAGMLGAVARKIGEAMDAGGYERVVCCELCPGDLDVCAHLPGVTKLARRDVYAGTLQPRRGDNFIGTRFHFRMLMEHAGATGMAVLADSAYYANKHEAGAAAVNFLPGRTTVVSLHDFLSNPIAFPPFARSTSLRAFLKRLEFRALGLLTAVSA